MVELSIKTDISAVEHFVRKYPDISLKVREAKLTEAMALYESELKKETPYGAGPIHLRDSMFTSIVVRGLKVVGMTGTPLEHGEPVEFGTKPHFPPIGPLQFWVEKKLGIDDEKKSKSIAYAIAHTIAKKGTLSAAMFGISLIENESKMMAILSEIPAEIIREVKRLMS